MFSSRVYKPAQDFALLGIALGLTMFAPSMVQAHPFAFDTGKMVGFEVLTAEDGAMDATDMVVIEYDGPITFPMAENLREIWTGIVKSGRFQTVVLRLNSPGGTQAHGEEVIGILREIRERVKLVTVVGEHDLCASMCIPVFIQGETRFASPASAWMFHGAARYMSNVPSLAMTTSTTSRTAKSARASSIHSSKITTSHRRASFGSRATSRPRCRIS